MKITKTLKADETVLALAGCLDTAAAADFEAALKESADVPKLVIDFTWLEFIASSGLRSLVSANKRAVAEGRSIVLTGMNDVVADVFDVTGLTAVFTIR